MALLTTSQLTFYDMKDAYHVEINPDYIVVKCDENGNSKEATNIEIKYGIYCGSTRVPGTATVDFKIGDVQVGYEGSSCTDSVDGEIKFSEIAQGTKFTDIDSIHITFTETNGNDGDEFTFEKYIAIVQSVAGEAGRGISEVKEYYQVSSSASSAPTDDWTESVPTMTEENKYLWNYEETVYTSGDIVKTTPAIIGVYGSQGRGISSITNYYLATSEQNGIDRDTDGWTNTIQTIDKTKKYLWNYEEINYTSGDPTYTDPVIIGAFGANGESAFVFEIYSQDGLVFREDLSEITLRTIAYDGSTVVTGAEYWWYYNENGELKKIENENSSVLTVSKSDPWCLNTITCKMEYNGEHEYHIALVDQVNVYTSVVKYATTNVFTSSDKYLLAYMALYKNGEEVDMLQTDVFVSASSVGDDGIIKTSVKSVDGVVSQSGDLIYFVIPDATYANRYGIVLGQYDGANWNKVDFQHDYFYTNSKYNDKNYENKIVVISREDVANTLEISFNVYKTSSDDESPFSIADGNITDIKDPIVSSLDENDVNAQYNPKHGQLWIDTSSSPYVVKICSIDADNNNIEWIESNQYDGAKIHTSKPNSYSIGDVWILAENEECYPVINGKEYKYEHGSMLYAFSTTAPNFDDNWRDTSPEIVEMRDNIAQYFTFNEDDGVKIAQKDNKFYVKISASEMGFYDNTSDEKKVVSIGNQSATIKNLNAEDSAAFSCDTDFNSQINIYNPYNSTRSGFTWKIETNGSLSLVNTNNIQKTIRGTWEDVFLSEEDGTYKLKYKIGDIIPLDLGSEGIVDMQIAAFDTDILTNGDQEIGKAKITWISKQALATPHRMSPALMTNTDGTYTQGTGTIEGWYYSEMSRYLLNEISLLIPEVVMGNIKCIKKSYRRYTSNNSPSNSVYVYDTRLWVPSSTEIGYNLDEQCSACYPLFTNNQSRIKYNVNTGQAVNWWTRSASTNSYYYCVDQSGNNNMHAVSTNLYGVVIGFCT